VNLRNSEVLLRKPPVFVALRGFILRTFRKWLRQTLPLYVVPAQTDTFLYRGITVQADGDNGAAWDAASSICSSNCSSDSEENGVRAGGGAAGEC
jgi:hypothetical protein